MQINRSVSKSKEVVYTVEDNGAVQFQAVIDENHDLLVAYPAAELSRPHARVLEKLVTKAKARDGVRQHVVYFNRELKEENSELVIAALEAA
ncbi:TPA: hypothetical protein ACTPQ1_004531 [Salmonella enterica]